MVVAESRSRVAGSVFSGGQSRVFRMLRRKEHGQSACVYDRDPSSTRSKPLIIGPAPVPLFFSLILLSDYPNLPPSPDTKELDDFLPSHSILHTLCCYVRVLRLSTVVKRPSNLPSGPPGCATDPPRRSHPPVQPQSRPDCSGPGPRFGLLSRPSSCLTRTRP